jgi:hypothetical protein
MEGIMKKKALYTLLATCMIMTSVNIHAAETAENDFLDRIQGSYVELFPEFAKDEYHSIWTSDAAQYLGIDGAEADGAIDNLLNTYMSDVYGQYAVETWGDMSSGFAFDCGFLGDAEVLSIEGNEIAGKDQDGNEIFRHAYHFVQELPYAEYDEFFFHLYESDDEDAGMYRYFAFCDDTPDETYHLEFRYGPTLDGMDSYYTGAYAFWLAAGIPQDYSDELMENCIHLFAGENLGSGEEGDSGIFLSGEGTEESPYVIDNLDTLKAFAESVNDGSAYGYAGQYLSLASDIDLTGVEWEPIGNLSDSESYSTMFMGTFDGGGHTVTGLEFSSEGPLVGAGLFGVSAGEIRNLNMEGCSVSCTGLVPGDDQAVGIVVGYNMGGIVTGCTVKNSDAASLNCTGIIAGGSGGIVTDCIVEDCTVTVLGDNEFTDGIKQCDVAECGGLVVGGAFGGTVSDCTASGMIIAEGNEPVGLGGIAGCLEMMSEVKGNKVNVEITTAKGGHAIGGLCGYAGTHSDAEKMMEETGVEVTEYPSLIHDCEVDAVINVDGATHVGGLIGTNLYFFGEETTWKAYDCTVKAEIAGAVMPGSLFGRAENCEYSDCSYEVTLDGEPLENEVGETDVMYESLDQ